MRLYASSGRPGVALRQYRWLSEALSSGLGAEPSASTRALREDIAAGRGQASLTQSAGHPMEQIPGGGVGTHNLPAQRTAFVGRELEMVEVKRALAMTQLLTLTGTGGLGKTRLALEVASDLVGAYPDGVWLVELTPLTEEVLVPQAVAKAVKASEQPDRPLTETLVDVLREKKLLIVLDNCEHLVEAAAQLVDVLLSSCPHLRVVATSREALGLEEELLWRMDPLSVPDAPRNGDRDAHRAPAAGELERYDAVRLFVERARRYSPQFELGPENAGAVVQICRGLEGMPLAIELVAARMDVLAEGQIAERLGRALGLLRSSSRTANPRHQTLRTTLSWSYELLGEAERRLFGGLSVFADGFSLEAAEAVGEGVGIQRSDILESLLILIDKSLVAARPTGDGSARYRLLEPVRQYARECLGDSGKFEEVMRRHAEFFLALAEEAAPQLAGAQQQDWADRLEADHDNMRAALSWSLESESETALRLAGALARFWEMRTHFLEGSSWLEAALRQSCRAEAATRAKLMSEAGTFAFYRTDFENAIVLHGEALELYRQVGDDSGVAFALVCLGAQYAEMGDHESAAPFFEEGLALSRSIGDKRTTAGTLHNLADVERQRGNYERAKALGMESIAVAREIEDTWLTAMCVGWVGMLSVWSDEEHDQGEGYLKEALALNRELGNWAYVAYCLEGFAGLAGARGQGARAARLWGAVDALRTSIGAPLPPEPRPYYERSMAAARALLGEEAWEAAFAEGGAMSAEEATEHALSEEVAHAAERPLADGGTSMRLTRREREVADLVARGLSTRQIAQELVISERTVDKHVANLLKKLNLRSRDQVAARIAEDGAQLR
jgi:non-specific serine/threonine protein kinase